MKTLVRRPSNLMIRKGPEGTGVFASRRIPANSIIFIMRGDIVTEPTKTSVQVGKFAHIEDKTASSINHSCKPNATVHRETKSFLSLREIQVGEEITYDYNKNEDKLKEPLICKCCGKFIAGKDVPQE